MNCNFGKFSGVLDVYSQTYRPEDFAPNNPSAKYQPSRSQKLKNKKKNSRRNK